MMRLKHMIQALHLSHGLFGTTPVCGVVMKGRSTDGANKTGYRASSILQENGGSDHQS